MISDAFQVGWDTFDEGKLTTLPPGAFGDIPLGVRHFARADEEILMNDSGLEAQADCGEGNSSRTAAKS